jgi:putative acetyltransferase
MIVRPEAEGDAAAIHAVTEAAFEGHPHSDGSEPAIVDRLRKARALHLSLVAEDSGVIVGHVAFSRVGIAGETGDWFGLGPVSVLPTGQGTGVGSALIREGLERLQAEGAAGCVVAGDAGYYRRFGFRHDAHFTLEDMPPEYFLILAFIEVYAGGAVSYHQAFYG